MLDPARLSNTSPVSSPSSVRDSATGQQAARRSIGIVTVTLATALAVALAMVLATPSLAQSGLFDDAFKNQRRTMIDRQLKERGIVQPDLLSAMENVPRHQFVPKVLERQAYEDQPVTISPGKTLSQAYLSARMISLLELSGDERVLEVGTGTGYDAAILSRIASEVWTIEIDPELGERARTTLSELGYDNVHVEIGDGYRGWPKAAPFDAILVTTAPQRIPQPLFDQLKVGGKMVIAVGFSLHQDLQVITKTSNTEREVQRVSLISLTPMTGEVTLEPEAGGRL